MNPPPPPPPQRQHQLQQHQQHHQQQQQQPQPFSAPPPPPQHPPAHLLQQSPPHQQQQQQRYATTDGLAPPQTAYPRIIGPLNGGGGESPVPDEPSPIPGVVDRMEVDVPRLSDIEAILPNSGFEVEDETVFRWSVPSWNAIKGLKKTYSPEFECGGTKWRLLIFPSGNQAPETVSVFMESLEAANAPKTSNWHACVHFAIAIANPEDESIYRHSVANHRYNPTETDWGFSALVKFAQLFGTPENQSRPLLENDQTTFVAVMRIYKDPTGVLWHNFVNYDSKKETGFVGLKNQGATCYMNSLLQSLYFTNYFRKATFAIPTENDEPTKSIPLALQRVFYQLHHSDLPVGTTELTKSFGWDTVDSFMQHDVQEFNRVLQDNLESKMKGSKAEGAISRLFVGKYKSFIKCINVNYESSRIEDYYDIQLNVKGFKNLRESFVDYIVVETLDGDNKYMAEGFGLQDARKGVIFTSYPPVLHLQLKRFEYDMERDAMVKINDRYEFPQEIDLTDFLEGGSSANPPQKYHLHGVLVHSGDLHGGHYCAFLKPEVGGKWFKFDDDRVTPVTEKEVLEENYGGDTARAGGKIQRRLTNAYMLVYIRESDIANILSPVTDDDIPEHLRKRFDEERQAAEQKKRDKEEQHLYLTVKVLFDEQIKTHGGFDLCNFEDKSQPITELLSLRLRKDETLAAFKARMGERMNRRPELIRVSAMIGRQNKTVRPDTPMTSSEEDKSLEYIKDKFVKSATPDLRLYVEAIDEATFEKEVENPAPLHSRAFIFIKFYDPRARKMEYIGKLAVSNKASAILDYLPLISEMARLPPDVPLKLFEEIKPDMIDPLDPRKSFSQAELGDGDIICVQRELLPAEIEELKDPSLAGIPGYFDNLRNRQVVVFKHRPKEREQARPDVDLTLSKKMTYDVVLNRLGEALGWDPLKLRLSLGPNSKQYIKRSPTLTLQEMLHQAYYVANPNAPSTLYFELLDIQLSELENKRFLKFSFADRYMREQGPYEILVQKNARAREVVEEMRPKLPLDTQGTGRLRLFEVNNFKIHKVFGDEDFISTIGDFSTIYVEETPAEELTATENDRSVNVFHFNKEVMRTHGIPFRFIIKDREPFSATKQRLLNRLGITEKEAAKVKFFYVAAFSRPKLLEDGDVLSDIEFMPNDCLAIDHVDKSGKSTRAGGVERAIKIFIFVVAGSYKFHITGEGSCSLWRTWGDAISTQSPGLIF
ncbi:ubiquitin carboxyl-terminal hydrolase 5 [Zopfochytrium polystomum]|nr:ubiquitin carboxyl-terminal hydrolase 5 [Zopfochytrium polystomum]